MAHEFNIKNGFITSGQSYVYNNLTVSGLTVSSVPTNDDTLTQILARDSSGIIKYRSSSSFGGGGSSTFTGGTVSGATNFTAGVTANTIVINTTNTTDAIAGTDWLKINASGTIFGFSDNAPSGQGFMSVTNGTVTGFGAHVNNTDGMVFGSYNSYPLTLRTGNINRVVIDTAGKTTFSYGVESNTISATTYYNLPLDIRVTGGTYSNGTATFTNNTGGTFSVTGFSTTTQGVTGITASNGLSASTTSNVTTIGFSGGTIPNSVNFTNGLSANTIYTTGFTLNGNYASIAGNRNVIYLKNSNGSGNQSNGIYFGSQGTSLSWSVINDLNADGTSIGQLDFYSNSLSKSTVSLKSNGDVEFSDQIRATSVSATTYYNLPTQVAGSTNQIQYNAGGVFGASSKFTYEPINSTFIQNSGNTSSGLGSAIIAANTSIITNAISYYNFIGGGANHQIADGGANFFSNNSIVGGYQLSIISSDGVDSYNNILLGGSGSTINESNSLSINNNAVLGGKNNQIFDGENMIIVGGDSHLISVNGTVSPSDNSIIAGGTINHIIGSRLSSIIGGFTNTINSPSTAGNADTNTIINSYNSVITNTNNIVNQVNTIIGGSSNTITETGNYDIQGNIVIGGFSNTISDSSYSAIFNSASSDISSTTSQSASSTIIGGSQNAIESTNYAIVGGGQLNQIIEGSDKSSIVGGYSNIVRNNSIQSVIVGGTNSIINGATNTVILGGNNITATQNNTAYVAYLNLNFSPLNDDTLTQVLVRDSGTGDIKYRTASSLGGGSSTFTGGTVSGATNFTGGLSANTISATTYYNLQVYNAGLLTNSSSWTDNGNGTITLPAATVGLYSQTGYTNTLQIFTLSAATTGSGVVPSLTNNDTNYVIVQYNGGSPRWYVVSDTSSVDGVTTILTHTIYRLNNFIHLLDFGNAGITLPNKLNDRVIATNRFGRESGFALGLSGSGVVTLTSGVAWNGSNRQSLIQAASNSSVFFQSFHTGSTWTYTTTSTTLNNLYYDTSTNYSAATAGKYLVNWYYRGQETGNHLYEVWSTAQYDNASDAQLATEPLSPPLVSSHAFLVGRIIVQVGATTGSVQSAFVQTFQATSVAAHNDLTGLQGGSAGQYYHLTSSQYTNNAYTNVNNNFSTSQTITGDLISSTVSATTYYNLPVSGLTQGSNITLTNNGQGNYTISSTGGGGGSTSFTGGTITGPTVFQSGFTANTVVYALVTLNSGATISVNAVAGNEFKVTLGSNSVLGNPTGAVDGQYLRFAIRQDASGNRNLTFDTKYRFGNEIGTPSVDLTANKTSYLGVRYNAADDKFDVISFVSGY